MPRRSRSSSSRSSSAPPRCRCGCSSGRGAHEAKAGRAAPERHLDRGSSPHGGAPPVDAVGVVHAHGAGEQLAAAAAAEPGDLRALSGAVHPLESLAGVREQPARVRRGHARHARHQQHGRICVREAQVPRARGAVPPAAHGDAGARSSRHAAAVPDAQAIGAREHVRRRARAVACQRVRHLPGTAGGSGDPRRSPELGAAGRRRGVADLSLDRASQPRARARDAGRVRVHVIVVRLLVASGHSLRRPPLYAARGAGESRGRARAGHRADDGRRRGHRATGAGAVRGAPALVHPRRDGGERQGMRCLWALLVVATPALAAPPTAPLVVDDFQSSSAWSAVPASGVTMKLTAEPGPHGNALRVDFDFHGGGGYAVLHLKLDVDLPENYRFEFSLHGETTPQNLELKLIDDSGENVWWCNQVNFEYPREWTLERVRKRQVSFAWGPKGGGELHHMAALEFAITAGSGGKGTVWFDDLTLVPLPVPGVPPAPVATASSFVGGHEAAFAADTLASTWWESLSGDRSPALTLDLGTSREFGGLVLDWRPGKHAIDYDVEFDDGDGRWRTVREVRGSDGARDWLDLPESETRRVRLSMKAKPASSVALVGVRVMPLEWAAAPNAFLMAVAKESPRGHYPRAFLGEQVYWTVVGVDGDRDEGLLDEDGRLETGKGQFSIEPFLITENGVRTWADGTSEQEQSMIPIPDVIRRVDSLSLSVNVLAVPRGPSSELVATYQIANHAPRARRITLCFALRPFPVNPPSQFLNTLPGAGRIDSLRWEGDRVLVNRDRAVGVWAADTARFRCTTLDQGDLVARRSRRERTTRPGLSDPGGRA